MLILCPPLFSSTLFSIQIFFQNFQWFLLTLHFWGPIIFLTHYRTFEVVNKETFYVLRQYLKETDYEMTYGWRCPELRIKTIVFCSHLACNLTKQKYFIWEEGNCKKYLWLSYSYTLGITWDTIHSHLKGHLLGISARWSRQGLGNSADALWYVWLHDCYHMGEQC